MIGFVRRAVCRVRGHDPFPWYPDNGRRVARTCWRCGQPIRKARP